MAERFAEWVARETGIRNASIGPALAGGNSNVTRLVETADGLLVLRHPPVDTVSDLAGAGIAREYRFISAIAEEASVAPPIAFCEYREIIGAPFSLTGYVPGISITETMPPAYPDTVEARDEIGRELIAALASVHDIDPAPLGLGDMVKAHSFVVRQVRRWQAVRREHKCRELPLLETIAQWLLDTAPEPEAVRIVHCDYHLDNALMDEKQARLNAILDWEMATIADPMVDLGLVTALWNRDEGTPHGFGFVQRISNMDGVISGSDLARIWSKHTGFSIDRLAWFQAFALWRLAAIVEGAYVLFQNGQVTGEYESGLEFDVPNLLLAARRFAAIEGMS